MKSESKIQQEFVQWFNNNYCLIHHNPRWMILHIPNEGKNNGKLVSIGLYPGVADLLIVAPNGKSFFIEVKAQGGNQSPNQKKFEKHCNQTGVNYWIVDNIEDALAIGDKIVREFAILK